MSTFKSASLLSALILLCSLVSFAKQPVGNPQGFAVVELFTSEGCSSCPAAEAALADIHSKYPSGVFILEFHVDYWDNIGWKDVYSSKDYTLRQQHYVTAMHLNTAYTPQAVINGKQELVGSDRKKLGELIEADLRKVPANTVNVTASANNNEVTLNYTLSNTNGEALNCALVQKSAETDVRRGENAGRKLQHFNVVRSLKTIYPAQRQGSISIALPKGLNPADCMVIAYTQNKQTMEITSACQVALK
jgi:hypothetical protein